MNTSTIKINSFESKNAILVNNKTAGINSELMNYHTKPIIDVAEKILNTLEAEFNDEFDVVVYGNLFEQRFVSALCEEREDCRSCICRDTEISLSTVQRIGMLKQITDSAVKVSVGLQTNIPHLSLPEIPGVCFDENSTNRIVVSDGIEYIRQYADGDCKVAFLQNGKTQRIGKMLVIGCTEDKLCSVVHSYIDTYYINPEISRLAKCCELTDEIILVNRIEPYLSVQNNITLNLGEKYKLPIKAIPSTANLENLSLRVVGNAVHTDGLSLEAVEQGECTVEVYKDTPIPVATVKVIVEHHVLVEKINLGVECDSECLCEGRKYPLSVSFEPDNAEDIKSIRFTTSDSDIAEVIDGNLLVKKEGSFSVKAETANACTELDLKSLPKIKSIKLSKASCQMYLGDVVEINTSVTPENAYDSRYKWVTSDKNVAVVGVDDEGHEMIKAVGIGEATIKCISLDNPNVCESIKISVASTFEKDSSKTISLGTIGVILSYIFALISKVLFWPVAVATVLLLFVFAKKEKDENNKILLLVLLLGSVCVRLLLW